MNYSYLYNKINKETQPPYFPMCLKEENENINKQETRGKLRFGQN